MADSPDLVGSGWSTAKISTILKNTLYAVGDEKMYDYFMSKGYALGEYTRFEDFDGTKAPMVYTYNDGSAPVVVLMKHKGVIDSDTWIKCNEKLQKNNQIGNASTVAVKWINATVKDQMALFMWTLWRL